MLRDYLTNPVSGLPHHWLLGVGVAIIGALAFVVPFPWLLVAGGALIAVHDLDYHRRHGWDRKLRFRREGAK